MCIDFRNLNKASLKHIYPLPKMDYILQKVVGSSQMSMMDVVSRYNKVDVHPEDQKKISFTMPWGTFMYARIPFILINVEATFQRAMDIKFVGE